MTVDTTEIYEAVPDTELIENSEVLNVQGEESISQGVKEDNTEVVTIDNSTPAVGSTVQTVDYASNLDSISMMCILSCLLWCSAFVGRV